MEHTATEIEALRNELHNDSLILHDKLNLLLNKNIKRAYKKNFLKFTKIHQFNKNIKYVNEI